MSAQLPWQRAWVTGASQGIGAALTERLVSLGVEVYASARSETALRDLQLRCENQPGRVVIAPLDTTDPSQIEALVQQWNRTDSWPDLVVLNAGTHTPFTAQAFSAESASRLLQVNLQGTINCLEPVLKRYLQLQQGQIAVMASVCGYTGLPTAAAYGASKAALINLCEALYLDLIHTPVKLQVINPGFVKTPLTDLNTFKMPALMGVEDAADRIVKGLRGNRFEISFPKRFVWFLKLLRLLPYPLYFRLVGRIVADQESL